MNRWTRSSANGAPSDRGGFTLIELVLVLMIAGVLTAVALPSLSGYLSRQDVRGASEAFMLAAARARSAAVARSDLVRLTVDPESERIRVSSSADGVLHSVDLSGGDREADILTPESLGGDGVLEVLYTPRGFVDPGQEDGGMLPVRVGFERGDHAVWTTMTVAGHVERE